VVARDRRSAVGRERGEITADKNLAIRLDDDDVNRAVRVRIETAAPPASTKPTRAIKLNRADERNLFPAEFFIFGFSFGLCPRGYLDERPGVNLFAGSIWKCVMVA
jgi:hypothetical protein